MRRGLNTFRKCGCSVEIKLRANGDTDVMEVLRKPINMLVGSY